MKKVISKIITGLSLLSTVVALAGAHSVSAAPYTDSMWGKMIPSPDAYVFEKSIGARELGLDSLEGLSDSFYKNEKLYIVSKGKFIITDSKFENVQLITSYMTDDGEVSISLPTGVFVAEDGHIFLCEEEMGLIVEFDENVKWIRNIGDPVLKGITVKYAPTKAVVDSNGRIFVKAKNIYEGIVELDPEGNFNRYLGANKVTYDPMEIFWKNFSTDAQKEKQKLILPTDYSDLAMDNDGFLMATVRDNKSATPVRRINGQGADILELARANSVLKLAMGDYIGSVSSSQLSVISTAEDGRFAILDGQKNRVYVYSYEGLLLYTLGGSGKTYGSFSSAVDICFMGEKIIVLDFTTRSVEVFKPTEYGQLITEALKLEAEYDYEGSSLLWQKVYDINPSLLSANIGLAKRALRSGDYEGAMSYYKKCADIEGYSSAYERVRENWLDSNGYKLFLWVIAIIALIEILKAVFRRLNKNENYVNNSFVKVLKKVRYEAFTFPKYVLSNPFKAFDDIKLNGKGNVIFCFIVYILYGWAVIVKMRGTGFVMNVYNPSTFNLPLVLSANLLPFVIFIIGSWSTGTLLNGSGKLVQIFKAIAYSLYPAIWLYIIGTILSNYVTLNESGLVSIIFTAAMVILFFYGFISHVTIHEYGFVKGVVSLLATAIAMVIILFIVLLMAQLVTGFVNDWGTIFDEFSLYYM